MILSEVKWVARLRRWWNSPGIQAFREQVLVPYVVHRALLVAVVSLTTAVLPVDRVIRALPGNPIAEPWLRWDSLHYLHVAMDGYGPLAGARQNGFFPLYPYLVSVLSDALPLPWAALVVSNTCALGALELLRRLALHYGDVDYAKRVVWIGLLFPTSYYLTAAYSESTYLLVAVGAVLAWHNDRWRWAAVCAAAAVLTRPVGAVALTVPFVLGWLLRRGEWKRTAALCAGALLGLGGLLSIYYVQTGDPLAFLHASGVQNLRVFWEEEPTALSWALLADEGFGRNLMQKLLNWSSLGLGLGCAAVLARQRSWELSGLCLVSLALPLYFHHSLVDLCSMSRYVLAAFPIFLVLAKWFPEGKSLGRLYDAGSQMLQVALAAIFGSGRWLE